MSTKPLRPKSEQIRHRIKEIELQPITSNYPISVKLFVDDQEVSELPRIKRGNDLKWSRPIICREAFPESKVTLEIREIHRTIDRSFKSEAYAISDVQGLNEKTLAFSGTRWTAKLTLLTPETAKQSHEEAMNELQGTELAPSVLEKLGKSKMVFEAILDFGGAVADAHPTAKLVFSVCTVAWKKLKEQEQLQEDTQKLIDSSIWIVNLAKIVEDYAEMDQLKTTIEEILVLLEDIFIYVLEREPKGGSGITQALRGFVDSRDRDLVKVLLDRLEGLRKNFDSAVGAEIHRRQLEQILRGHLDRLKPVEAANYDPKKACLGRTREDIIKYVVSWTELDSSATADLCSAENASEAEKSKHLLWLYGPAGIGKSSIAASICRELERKGILAASFFCKRNGGSELRDPLHLINTIAHGLAARCPEYGKAVAAEIERDPGLCGANTTLVRYKGLIDTPVRELASLVLSSPLIVLIDALDECGTIEEQQELIKHLSDMSQLVPWLNVIITSRPHREIQGCFNRLNEQHISSCDVGSFDASADIRSYIKTKLAEVATDGGWEWPEGVVDVDQLCRRANGLFIWAATVMRHIEGPAGSEVAVQRLRDILGGQQSAVLDLDTLYEKVLKDGIKDDRDDNRAVFRRCMGAIIVTSARRPLSLPDLSSLLLGQLDKRTLKYVVESLRSVLHEEEKSGVLRFYHQSFVDYATDPLRSREFYIHPEVRNAELARGCLETMARELKFNICELETSHLFNHQVPNLSERVRSKISRQLDYSCVYWISHLGGTPRGTLKGDVEGLLDSPRALYWLEALSLLSRIDVAIIGLLGLLEWVPDEAGETRGCVIDIYRFILAFYDAISASTPHLYVSAFALAPESALIVRRLKSHFPGTVVVTSGGDKTWPDWLRTLSHPEGISAIAISNDGRQLVTGCYDKKNRLWDMNGAQVGEPLVGHSSYVTSVAFSPNGDLIVSGSDDTTVRMWDAKTRAQIGEPLAGHSDSVNSVAFSPNGDLIVSGSDDNTVRMWDAKTRAQIGEPLVGHSLSVKSIAFSPNGDLIVSGSDDNTVRMWDAKTRAQIGEPLVGHSLSVASIAFSPNGNLIVSGSFDNTVRKWDAKTHAQIGEPLVGHSSYVTSVAFSPNGDLIVSGSLDNTVRMWDAKTRAQIGEPLVRHSSYVTSVAFSPNGNLIVSGSDDNTVRMWDAKTGAQIGEPLVGHSSYVTSVAFSPNGNLIVSGSLDNTVWMWDAKTRAQIGEPLVGHSSYVTSVAFSPNSDLIVSGSWDNTVRMWDAKTRAQIGEPLVGHSHWVNAVAFSPNGDLIVSGSDDNTVRMWDAKTRAQIGEPLVGHSLSVKSIAFSPNGDLIVSGSDDNTVRMWDAKTRAQIGEPLVGHSLSVASIAFSPNGNLIVSGSFDNTVRMWDAKTCAQIGEPLVGHSSYVTSVAFSPNDNLIVSGSLDNTVWMWDAKTHAQIGEPLVGHSSYVTSVAFSPNGDLIVSGSNDNTVRMWDAKTRAQIGEPLVGHSHWVNSVAFSPNGNLIVSGSNDNTVRMWDAKTCAQIGKPLVRHSSSVKSVAFSPNGDLIVSGSDDNTVRMWDAKTRAQIGEPLVGHSDSVKSIAFSPNGNLIVSGSDDNTVRMWDAKTHAQIGEPLVGHSLSVKSVAFSPNGDLIVSGSDDNTVRMWDAKTRAQIGEPLVGHSSYVTSVAFSPNSDLIVSGSDDNTVRMWDAKTRAQIGEPLVGHSHWVTSVAFSPNSDLIVSGSFDNTVRMWDAKTGAQIGEPLVGHSSYVTSVAFSPNGDLIVSGSWDNTVRMWDVKNGAKCYGPLAKDSCPLRSNAPLANVPRGPCNNMEPGTQIHNYFPCETSMCPFPSTTFGLPAIPQQHGWVSLDGVSLLLWLPVRYRRPYDPRALFCFSADPSQSTISLDFSQFAYGQSWPSIAVQQ